MKTPYLLALALLVVVSCKKEEAILKESYLDLPAEPATYVEGINNNIPELGRVLFYDKSLSVNNSVSCGSCHKQVFGFADNVAFSRGFDNQLTLRNSMPIQNIGSGFFGITPFIKVDDFTSPGFSQSLFWDGRESNLDQMVLKPIINHVEMGITDLNELAEKLKTMPYYEPLFKKAYDSEEITPQKISTAISWFVRSISTNQTKLDQSRQGLVQLSALELNGQSLFFTKYDCNSCHQVTIPNGYLSLGGGFANIGLDDVYADDGLAKTTGRSTDIGKFKIPSLRNVSLTAPYMHDGRFATLEEVMDHYSEGMATHQNLDGRLRNGDGQARIMNISESEKQAIIAFLHTLTDFQAVTNPKFANPFKSR
jgi:cytochrome c peroxidase